MLGVTPRLVFRVEPEDEAQLQDVMHTDVDARRDLQFEGEAFQKSSREERHRTHEKVIPTTGLMSWRSGVMVSMSTALDF